MRKKDKKSIKTSVTESKRQFRMMCSLNQNEQKIVDRYLAKYKISNKSRWVRETLLMSIYKTTAEDYPTLFNERDMR